jgi:hypothetical protein
MRPGLHRTLRMTPAMEAGVTGKLWSLENIVRVVDEWEKQNTQNRENRTPD